MPQLRGYIPRPSLVSVRPRRPQKKPSAALLTFLLKSRNNLQIAARDTNFPGFINTLCPAAQNSRELPGMLLAAQHHEPYASGLDNASAGPGGVEAPGLCRFHAL